MSDEFKEVYVERLGELAKKYGEKKAPEVRQEFTDETGTHYSRLEEWVLHADGRWITYKEETQGGNNNKLDNPRCYRLEKKQLDYLFGTASALGKKDTVFSNWDGALPAYVRLPEKSDAFRLEKKPAWNIQTNMSKEQLEESVKSLEAKYTKPAA